MSNFRGNDGGKNFRKNDGPKFSRHEGRPAKNDSRGKSRPRFEQNDRPNREAARRSDKISPKQADLLEVCDLDRGIIKLIAKRAKVIDRMIKFKSLDAAAEKFGLE